MRIWGDWPRLRLDYLRALQWSVIRRLAGHRSGDRSRVLLDLGAGPMRYAVAFAAKANFEVVAGDIRFHEAAVRDALRHRVSPVMVDGQTLAFQGGAFDVVLTSSLLQMVPSPEDLLAECRRVLRPDGVLIITVPNHYQFIPTVLRAPKAVRRALGLPSTLD